MNEPTPTTTPPSRKRVRPTLAEHRAMVDDFTNVLTTTDKMLSAANKELSVARAASLYIAYRILPFCIVVSLVVGFLAGKYI